MEDGLADVAAARCTENAGLGDNSRYWKQHGRLLDHGCLGRSGGSYSFHCSERPVGLPARLHVAAAGQVRMTNLCCAPSLVRGAVSSMYSSCRISHSVSCTG